MNENKRFISDKSIQLTEMNPLDRLKELCRQGKYRYNITWDAFKNGFMCECELFYFLTKRRRQTLKRWTCWVETSDLREAQCTVVAGLLDEMGLGVDSNDDDSGGKTTGDSTSSENSVDKDFDNIKDDIVRIGMKMATGIFSKAAENVNLDDLDKIFAPLENKNKKWSEL